MPVAPFEKVLAVTKFNSLFFEVLIKKGIIRPEMTGLRNNQTNLTG
jgi:hypothetical protein